MKKPRLAGAILLVSALVAPLHAQNSTKTSSSASEGWSACYAGAHLAGAWSRLTMTDVGLNGIAFASRGTAGQTFQANTGAVNVGGQFGCDFKAGRSVLGGGVDLGWLDLSGSALDPGTTSSTTVGINAGLLGDVAARVGIPAGKTLLYGKGGWAFYDGKQSFSTTTPAFASNSNVGLFSGFVVGAGIEYKIHRHLTGSAQYAYYGFTTQTFNTLSIFGTNSPFNEKLDLNTFEVDLDYRFGRHL